MAGEYKDYYKILGVPKNATEKEIKSAYRKLARKHHPDVNQGDKSAEDKFKDVSEAYEILSEADKRAKYDQYGDQWREFSQGGGFAGTPFGQGAGRQTRTAEGGGGFGGLDDLFSALFGGDPGATNRDGFGGFRSGFRNRSVRRSPQDVEYEVEISFDDAYRGSTRSFALTFPNEQGTDRQKRFNDIRIPAGVKDGQRIRLAGQGPDGSDIYLKVTIRPDARYERRDYDIYTDFDVPYTVAALGGNAIVETPDGKKVLTVPAGTQSGRSFRLTGLGIPHIKGGGKGNLYARARITVPKEPIAKERDLLIQIAKLRKDEIKVES